MKVQSWAETAEGRLQQAQIALRTASKAINARNRELEDSALERYRRGGVTFEMLEDRLAEAQDALKEATRVAEDEAAERDALWHQLQDAQNENERLEKALEDLRLNKGLDKDGNPIYNPSLVAIDDFQRLGQRLEAAEQRAVEISSNGAKQFAQSARTIAYLEGECSRLKTLLDHYRCDILIYLLYFFLFLSLDYIQKGDVTDVSCDRRFFHSL